MQNLQAVLDLLGNDVRIVDSTSKSVDSKRGVQTLRFPGHLMPDDSPFDGEVPEHLNPSILKEWCNAVRREFDARLRRKEDQASSASRSGEGGSGGKGEAPTKRVPARNDAQDAREEVETGLEEALKAEVAKWARAERAAAEEAARHAESAAFSKRLAEEAKVKKEVAIKTLDFYLGEST